MKYRKKPIVIETKQWRTTGDHEAVSAYVADNYQLCGECGKKHVEHGWIKTLEGGHIVCPGDWIITGVAGERYPCKPDIFAETYELVE